MFTTLIINSSDGYTEQFSLDSIVCISHDTMHYVIKFKNGLQRKFHVWYNTVSFC